MATRFTFTGKLSFNGMETQNPYLREGKTKDGAKYKSINFSVSSNNNNRAYVEMFGMKRDIIKTQDADGNPTEIDWLDRLDPDVIRDVASYRHFIVNVNNERKEFITELDFIDYLNEIMDVLNDQNRVFTVTGNVAKNVYDGTIRNRFQVNSIYEVNEDSKKKLEIREEFFFNKESFDFSDWGKEKKFNISGYTKEYVDKDHKDCYVRSDIVFDASKIDFNDQKQLEILDARLSTVGCELDMETLKPRYALRRSNYYSMALVLAFFNGLQEKEFDESQLSPFQKKMIKAGESKVEDFRPNGTAFGSRIEELKYKSFEAKCGTKFENGPCATDEKASEFEDNIYYLPDEEDFTDAMNDPEDDEDEEEVEVVKPKAKDKASSKAKTKAKAKPEPEEEEDDEDDEEEEEDTDNLFG